MDFRLSPEQELLRDSARRYFAGQGGVVAHARVSGPAAGREAWSRFAEFGWLAMPVPEAAGGLGASLEDMAILCEEMGRGLAPVSFVAGALLPARILARCREDDAGATLWSAFAANSTRVAAALHEPDRRYELRPLTRASVGPDLAWSLSGAKSLVPAGAQADRLIVSAVVEPAGAAAEDLALFLIETDRPGVERRVYETLDGVSVADFAFDAVRISECDRLRPVEDACRVLEDALDEATIGLCAETLGCMDQAIELTAGYLKIRRQFGKALAEFQVLQHAVAEMSIDANSARSLLYRAMAAIRAPRRERQRAVSGCAIRLMQLAKSVTGSAVHLHGGIGMSCEVPVGHLLRRVLVSERLLGDREHHLARYLG